MSTAKPSYGDITVLTAEPIPTNAIVTTNWWDRTNIPKSDVTFESIVDGIVTIIAIVPRDTWNAIPHHSSYDFESENGELDDNLYTRYLMRKLHLGHLLTPLDHYAIGDFRDY